MLLLDEPLGALDLKLRQEMQVELKQIQQSVGITFVYVTHDQEEALTMSDRLAVFDEGRIVQVGSPAEVYEHPETNSSRASSASQRSGAAMNGPRFTVRPEKVRLLEGRRGRPSPERTPRPARIRDVVYIGMVTRYTSRASSTKAEC